MDDIDRALLEALRADARASMAELGRRVGLSRTAVLARVRRLEDAGRITGYHAAVSEPAGTATAHAARVGIVLHTPDVAAYVRRLATIREVEEVESVSGDFDLIVRLAAPSAARLDEILDRLNGWPQTVRTTTYVVLTRYVGPPGTAA